jgi:hypothetical protein
MGIKAIQEKTRHANIEVPVKHYLHDDEPAGPYFAKMLDSQRDMGQELMTPKEE